MMLPLLIELGWKSALIAGAALIANWAMRRRPAAERVFLLRIAIFMLLVLPAAALLLPPIDLPMLPASEAASTPPVVEAVGMLPEAGHMLAPAPASLPAPSMDWPLLEAIFYLAGVGAVLLHLAAGIVTLRRWTGRGVPVDDPRWQVALERGAAGLRRPVRLLASHDVAAPLSWGLAPAWILINADALARGDRADAVIAHEIAHVRRFDWPVLIVARVVAALFWFNPLVWLLGRTLARQSEIAADEAAVRSVARLDYAEALLAFASAPRGHHAATGMALWPSTLSERISMIVEARPHRRASRRLSAAMLACGVAVITSLAAAKPIRAGSPAAAEPHWVAGAEAPSVSVTEERHSRSAEGLVRPVSAGVPANSGLAAEPVGPMSAGASVPVASGSLARGSQLALAVPVPEAVPVPQPMPRQVRIVGQTGAEVAIGPNRTTLRGAPPAPQSPAAAQLAVEQRQRELEARDRERLLAAEERRRSEEARDRERQLAAEARRRAAEDRQRGLEERQRAAAENRPAWAREAASELTMAAAEMREGARNVELTAELPGVTAGKREEIRRNVQKMRDTADEFETRARALRGPGG